MKLAEAQPDTFPKLLTLQAQQRGTRPAHRIKHRGIWRTVTWQQLADDAAALAAALAARGLQRGAHVLLLGGNRPRLYAAMSAVHWLGAVAVPLYTDMTVAELAHWAAAVGATHAFAEDQEQVDKLLGVLPQCPQLRTIVYDQDRGMRHYSQPELLAYDALLAQGRARNAAQESALQSEAAIGTAQDAAFVLLSSGTGGAHKGVVLSHGALIDRARSAMTLDGLNDRDSAVACLPPAWIGQLMYGYAQPMVAGYAVCCPESSETLWSDMREIGPSIFLAPPRVLEALLAVVFLRMEDAGRAKRALYAYGMALARRVEQRERQRLPVSLSDRVAHAAANLLLYGPLRDVLGMSRVRVAYAAGEPVGLDLLAYFRSIGVDLRPLYVSTEAGGAIAAARAGQVRTDGVGHATPGADLKLTARRELLVRSPGVFTGYLGDAEATAAVFDTDGWLHTGDTGMLRSDGHLYAVDRLQDIGALADGSPYAPRPIEARLKFSPYVKDAVVYGHGRTEVCVLVDIDASTVGHWADRQGLSYTGHAELAALEEVYGLVGKLIAQMNTELAQDAEQAHLQVRRYAILTQPLSAESDLLTRMGQLRRTAIAERHAALIDCLYGAPNASGGPAVRPVVVPV